MNGTPVYIGIDPGVSGGMAAIDGAGRVLAVCAMPDTERQVLAFLTDLSDSTLLEDGKSQVRAVLEKVSASPQMGVVSAFTFGRGIGVLRTALTAAEIPFDEVTPGVWQKAMGVRQRTGKTTLGGTHVKDKNIAKRRAQDLFPSLKVTHAIADALLIADFCRRSALGMPAEASPAVPAGLGF